MSVWTLNIELAEILYILELQHINYVSRCLHSYTCRKIITLKPLQTVLVNIQLQSYIHIIDLFDSSFKCYTMPDSEYWPIADSIAAQ